MSKWNLQEMFHLFKLRGFLNLQLCLKFRLVFYTNQHVSLSKAFPLLFANNEKETTNIEKNGNTLTGQSASEKLTLTYIFGL